MASLIDLRLAKSLEDVAAILGFKAKFVAYIVRKRTSAQKYTTFTIPKATGGIRTINAPAPDLKNLQGRLSTVLQNCLLETEDSLGNRPALSHAFKPKHSILTNASVHKGKRYVFNIDLEDFFGTINFGRVRGFFLKNRAFQLEPVVATWLAQIACHEGTLPQGSPSSPVISNLIGHVLDIRLVNLAKSLGCDYSRYADDITFSSNKKLFPSEIAKISAGNPKEWDVGVRLKSLIERSGFTINAKKTRMQYRDSRQEVTGLVVNRKINVRNEYRRTARLMAHRLFKTGNFQIPVVPPAISENGTLEQLGGILNYIDTLDRHNEKLQTKDSDNLDRKETVYRRFLFFKDFYANTKPVVICEGKTDNIYIRAAIRQLVASYPELAQTSPAGKIEVNIRIYNYTDSNSGRILRLSGGSADLARLIGTYKDQCRSYSAPGLKFPVIVLCDNDLGSKPIYSAVGKVTKSTPDGTLPIYHICHNLYMVPTPLLPGVKSSMIEDFFDAKTLATKLNGKSFNFHDEHFNIATEYGKQYFAEHVVRQTQSTIDFNGFRGILDRFVSVIKNQAAHII